MKEVLKGVLKETDYKKVFAIIDTIDTQGSISPSFAQEMCGKSEATVWRYLNMLVNTGFVIAKGKTNNKLYMRKKQ